MPRLATVARLALAVTLTLGLAALPARADPVAMGDQVVVLLWSGASFRGTLESQDERHLVLRSAGGTRRELPLSSVRAVNREVPVGPRAAAVATEDVAASPASLTVAATVEDVDLVMGFVRARAPELLERRALALLQCTAMYDEPREDETHLAAMATLRDRYGVVVGFSSHVPGIRAPAVAAAMGAQVLEVHVTDDRTRAFRDHRLSLTMEELAALRRELEALPVLRGSPEKRVLESERENRKSFRRGLYPTRDLPAGHVLRAEDLVALRPQVGLGAERYFDLLGRRLTRDVTALDPFAETDVGD